MELIFIITIKKNSNEAVLFYIFLFIILLNSIIFHRILFHQCFFQLRNKKYSSTKIKWQADTLGMCTACPLFPISGIINFHEIEKNKNAKKVDCAIGEVILEPVKTP